MLATRASQFSLSFIWGHGNLQLKGEVKIRNHSTKQRRAEIALLRSYSFTPTFRYIDGTQCKYRRGENVLFSYDLSAA